MTDEEIMAMYWYMLKPVSFRLVTDNHPDTFAHVYDLQSDGYWLAVNDLIRIHALFDVDNRWYVCDDVTKDLIVVNGSVDSAEAKARSKFRSVDCAPNPKNLTAWEYNDGGNWRPSPGTSMVDLIY